MESYSKEINVQVNRNSFIDFVKGVLIFLVLYGHVIQAFSSNSSIDFYNDSVFKFIYSFHMPLFMAVSGYVFYWTCTKRSLTTVLINKLTTIGLPMILWGVIAWLNVSYYRLDQFNKQMFMELLDYLTVWFLWCVIVCSIAVAIVKKSRGGGKTSNFSVGLRSCYLLFTES